MWSVLIVDGAVCRALLQKLIVMHGGSELKAADI